MMRQKLTLIAFILIAAALFLLWSNLSSRMLAVESDTGSYLFTDNDDDLPGSITSSDNTDLSALQAQLNALQQTQRETLNAINQLALRVEQLEAQGRLGLSRQTIYFDHDTSQLSQSEKDKIDKILQATSDQAFISLLGQSDSTGDENYNHLLSLRRAAAVKAYMEESLKTAGRNNNLLITIDGTGEATSTDADTIDGISNRVVEVLVFE